MLECMLSDQVHLQTGAQQKSCSFFFLIFLFFVCVRCRKGYLACYISSVFRKGALTETILVNTRRNIYTTEKCIAFYSKV